jgi:hypothetical protein
MSGAGRGLQPRARGVDVVGWSGGGPEVIRRAEDRSDPSPFINQRDRQPGGSGELAANVGQSTISVVTRN